MSHSFIPRLFFLFFFLFRNRTYRVTAPSNFLFDRVLLRLNLTTLKERTWGDLIQLYKILLDFNIVNWKNKLETVLCVGTSSPLNLVAPLISKTPQRNHFLSIEFVRMKQTLWFNLPQTLIFSAEIIRLGSIN